MGRNVKIAVVCLIVAITVICTLMWYLTASSARDASPLSAPQEGYGEIGTGYESSHVRTSEPVSQDDASDVSDASEGTDDVSEDGSAQDVPASDMTPEEEVNAARNVGVPLDEPDNLGDVMANTKWAYVPRQDSGFKADLSSFGEVHVGGSRVSYAFGTLDGSVAVQFYATEGEATASDAIIVSYGDFEDEVPLSDIFADDGKYTLVLSSVDSAEGITVSSKSEDIIEYNDFFDE